MKKFYSLLVIALVAVMAFTLFAACDDPNDDEKQPIQVEGKVFAFDRTEASVVPGKEAALEAYIAEMGNPEIATVDDFLKMVFMLKDPCASVAFTTMSKADFLALTAARMATMCAQRTAQRMRASAC